jgi:hypothetical protein
MGKSAIPKSLIMLPEFALHKQETPCSCGPAATKMALEILGIKVPESELRKRMWTNSLLGTPPSLLARAYQGYLRENGINLRVRVRSGQSVTTDTLLASLQAGRPVIVSFYTENHFRKGTIVGHYSVVYGIDRDAGYLHLANPFGFKEKIEIDQFWKTTDFRQVEGKMPLLMKLSLKLGALLGIEVPRMVILLEGL